jgi:hypothetical protein
MSALLCSILVAVSACSKPCEQTGAMAGNPPWAAHPDVIAPGGTMCGMSNDTATLDYRRSDNPFVVVVDYLEGRGWSRTDQDIGNQEAMNVSFQRGAEYLTVRINGGGTYSRVIYAYRAGQQ